MKDKRKPIRARIVQRQGYDPGKCGACGEFIDGTSPVCRVVSGPHAMFRVCGDCVFANDVDASLEYTAAALIDEGYAHLDATALTERGPYRLTATESAIGRINDGWKLRGLIGRLRLPTWDEWQAAVVEQERQAQERCDADSRSRGFKDFDDEVNTPVPCVRESRP